MPELPEVQTTVNGLKNNVIGLKITNAWSNYDSQNFKGSRTIKDPKYFTQFKKKITGRKIISIERRGKNILINLSSGETIIVHMKMTGHFLYGLYQFNKMFPKDPWEPIEPEGLKDPYNRHIHFVLTFNNNRHLALSDTRKFAKITLIDSRSTHNSAHLKNIGPEPLDQKFTFSKFIKQLQTKPNDKIKLILLNQSIIAGIGNIYADESLWRAGIHPLQRVKDIPTIKCKKLFHAIKNTLTSGIDLGGDSMSDYRNLHGQKGKFQGKHHAYQKTGKKCDKRRCVGTITRIVIGGRGTHYCDRHQKLSTKNSVER